MKQIIVVDDEPAMVRMTQKKIEGMGYEVTGITKPEKALDLIKSNPRQFDLMITDMVMPKLSGAELSKAVLKIRPDMPIILCSGYCHLSQQESRGIRIYKFMEKPVALTDLASVVQEALAKKD